MSPQNLGMLSAFGLVGAIVAYSTIDRGMNYKDVTAEVKAVKIDCFIKSGKKSVVEKGSDNLAYMDCESAPQVAIHFGHGTSAVNTRASIEYTYKSPVDGQWHTGKYAHQYAGKDSYKVGQTLKIKAHVRDAAKSKL